MSDIHCNRENEFSCDLVTGNRTRKLDFDVPGSFSNHIWVFQSVTLVLREIHTEFEDLSTKLSDFKNCL